MFDKYNGRYFAGYRQLVSIRVKINHNRKTVKK